MDNKNLVYNLQCLPRPITPEEVDVLRAMFESPGWRVLMKIKKEAALGSAEIALGMNDEMENQRREHRAIYHSLLHDITLKDTFDSELSATKPTTEEDSDLNLSTTEDVGVIPLK
ncbi:MAG: hypothetical protein PHI16_01930 [Methanocellales archaeon]|nr:hypothetical protein [Methanocellales archaeon]